MKVKLLLSFLLLHLFALNCATTSDPEHLESGSGVKYIQKQKQLDYKLYLHNDPASNTRINPIALYFDFMLYPINLVYFPLNGKLLVSEVDAEGNVQEITLAEHEREILSFEEKIKTDEVKAGLEEGEKEKLNGIVAFFDFTLFAPFNLFVYPSANRTVLGTVNNNTIKGYDDIERNRAEGSVKEKRARTYLRKLGVYRKPQAPSIFEQEGYMKLVTFGFPGVVSSSQPTDQLPSNRLYFSAERIMDLISPEDFDEALEDANWDIEDLELSEAEIQELKENGYLASAETTK